MSNIFRNRSAKNAGNISIYELSIKNSGTSLSSIRKSGKPYKQGVPGLFLFLCY